MDDRILDIRRPGLHVAGRLVLALLLASLLPACGDRDAGADRDAADAGEDATLPAPTGADGSVTGMPGRPGPGPIGTPEPRSVELPPGDGIDEDGNPLAPDAVGESASRDPAGNVDPAAGDGPGPEAAVEVVRAYYAAINAGSYARAYTLWSDGGNASGQSPQQFADGFDDTSEVAVEFMAPGRIDAAAGSRYIEVPVALRATRDDGSVHHYVGAYTLRRAVVDGASEEQRAWRIAAADIREVQP